MDIQWPQIINRQAQYAAKYDFRPMRGRELCFRELYQVPSHIPQRAGENRYYNPCDPSDGTGVFVCGDEAARKPEPRPRDRFDEEENSF